MSGLPWTSRRSRPEPAVVATAVRLAEVEAERDDLVDRLEAVLIAQRELVQENRKLRSNGRLFEADEAIKLHRQAEQDRRNVVVVSDALALSEGRSGHTPMLDEAAAREVLAEVRATVAAVLGKQLGRVR